MLGWTDVSRKHNPEEPSNLSVTNLNGDVYQGQWQNHQRHGWGRYLYLSRLPEKPTLDQAFLQRLFVPRYEGEWINGQKDGVGSLIESEEKCAAGTWFADRLHGYGIQFLGTSPPEDYEGFFIAGRRHGYGKLSSKRRVLIGPFQKDQPHGACFVSVHRADRILIREYDRGRAVFSMDLFDALGLSSGRRPRTCSTSTRRRRESMCARFGSVDDLDLPAPRPSCDAAQPIGIAGWTTAIVLRLVKLLRLPLMMERVIEQNKIDGEAVLALVKVCCADSDALSEKECTSIVLEELGMPEEGRPLAWFFMNCCNEIVRADYRRKERMMTSGRSIYKEVRLLISNLPELSPLICSSSELSVKRLIGEGGFGRVYEAFSSRLQITVAAKEFRREACGFLNQASRQLKALRNFAAELSVLSGLRHPNIILLLGVVTDCPHPMLLSEFVEGGTLFDLLQKRSTPLDPSDITAILLDVCAAMRYLHNKGVLHCDLKSSNILLSRPAKGISGPRFTAKICDLGLARSFTSAPTTNGVSEALGKALSLQDGAFEAACTQGTAQWMAPELFRGNARTRKTDVYAFGLIVWEMCTGAIPFSGLSHSSIHAAVGFGSLRIRMPSRWPRPVLGKLIEMCTDPSPALRPSFTEIYHMLEMDQREVLGGKREYARHCDPEGRRSSIRAT